MVDGVSNGKPIAARFGMRLEGGARMTLPDLDDPAVLRVGAIDNPLGGMRGVTTIRRL